MRARGERYLYIVSDSFLEKQGTLACRPCCLMGKEGYADKAGMSDAKRTKSTSQHASRKASSVSTPFDQSHGRRRASQPKLSRAR